MKQITAKTITLLITITLSACSIIAHHSNTIEGRWIPDKTSFQNIHMKKDMAIYFENDPLNKNTILLIQNISKNPETIPLELTSNNEPSPCENNKKSKLYTNLSPKGGSHLPFGINGWVFTHWLGVYFYEDLGEKRACIFWGIDPGGHEGVAHTHTPVLGSIKP